MCKSDAGFVRAWGEIGLSDESKQKRFLWFRMLKALLVSIYKVDQRAAEIANKDEPAPTEPVARSSIGIFAVEADVATLGVWVTDRVVVPVTLRSGDRIRLEGVYFPESIAKQIGSSESTVEFLLSDGKIHTSELKSHGDFVIEFLAPDLHGAVATALTIASSNAFVPKSIGQGEDERKLAWRMKTLLVGNNTIFDCTHVNSRPDND
jgi:hypothetical protein